MKNIYEYLEFRLDSEYEDLEFEVIPIPPFEIIEKNLSLEPCEYFGEINEILGCRTHQVILFYNADRLMRVIIKFKGNVLSHLKQRLETYNPNLPPVMFLKMYLEPENDLTILTYQKKILTSR